MMSYAATLASRGFMADFLACVPASDRQWHPHTQAWTFDSLYDEIVMDLLEMHDIMWNWSTTDEFKNGVYNYKAKPKVVKQEAKKEIPKPQPPKPPPPNNDFFRSNVARDEDYETLGISKYASFEVAKDAYRALSLKHHPDRTGDSEMMKRINVAWDRIKKELQ